MGIKTTERVLVATQGNWKQRLFPARLLNLNNKGVLPSKVAEMSHFCVFTSYSTIGDKQCIQGATLILSILHCEHLPIHYRRVTV